MADIKMMTFEEKLKMLPETDRAYVYGFVERAYYEYLKQGKPKEKKRAKNEK